MAPKRMQTIAILTLSTLPTLLALEATSSSRKALMTRVQAARGRSDSHDEGDDEVDIEFGGEKNKGSITLQRPSFVKSMACHDAYPSSDADAPCRRRYKCAPAPPPQKDMQCEDCTDRDQCWHGDWTSGYQYIEVPTDSSFASYAFDVWANCSTGNGEWQVYASTLRGGNLKVFVGDSDTAVATFASRRRDSRRRRDVVLFGDDLRKEGTFKLDGIAESENTRIRVVFYPDLWDDDRNEVRRRNAKVQVKAEGVDKSADTCMSMKVCLDEFDLETAAGFEMRNSNLRQKQCLDKDAGLPSNLPSGDLTTVCDAWLACLALTPDMKQYLRSMLTIALGDQSLLAQRGLVQESAIGVEVNGDGDPSTCVNPATDDPESWDCACHANMVAHCGGIDEACMTQLMCNHARICSAWKGVHCSSSLLGRRQKRSFEVSAKGSLDVALQGKCAA